MTTSPKKLICLISTEGKTAEQITTETWAAVQKYNQAEQDALQKLETKEDEKELPYGSLEWEDDVWINASLKGITRGLEERREREATGSSDKALLKDQQEEYRMDNILKAFRKVKKENEDPPKQ